MNNPAMKMLLKELIAAERALQRARNITDKTPDLLNEEESERLYKAYFNVCATTDSLEERNA